MKFITVNGNISKLRTREALKDKFQLGADSQISRLFLFLHHRYDAIYKEIYV